MSDGAPGRATAAPKVLNCWWGRCPVCGLFFRISTGSVRMKRHDAQDGRPCDGRGQLADEIANKKSQPKNRVSAFCAPTLGRCAECGELRPVDTELLVMPRHVVRGGVPCPGEGKPVVETLNPDPPPRQVKRERGPNTQVVPEFLRELRARTSVQKIAFVCQACNQATYFGRASGVVAPHRLKSGALCSLSGVTLQSGLQARALRKHLAAARMEFRRRAEEEKEHHRGSWPTNAPKNLRLVSGGLPTLGRR